MRVIARRSKYLGAVYIFGFLLMLLYPLIRLDGASPRVLGIFYMLSAPLALMFLVLAIMFFRTPKSVVLYDGEYTFYLPHGVKIDAKDITNVTAQKSNKYRTRKGGALTIYTAQRVHRLLFVANCDEAIKDINNAVYKRKSELGYTTMY